MIGVGTCRITPRAKKYVNEVLDSERLSYGPFTQTFERVFAAAHDCRYAIMTNSGTSSLQIALAALKTKYGWHDGDEVIVPAVTFIATANIVIQNNMKPVFVDVDPVWYELDPTKIEEKITPRTRCVIPVHLFGSPCDMDSIMAIAAKHGLRVIEDSCETMFTRYKGKPVGSFGDIGCFSTYVAHILITGVGGLCTTNSPDLAVQLRSLMNHGRDSIYISIDDDKNKSAEELGMIIQRRFSFIQMGYSYRVTELEGALGLAQFEEREEMLIARRANAAFLVESLKRHSEHVQLPVIRPDSEHAFMMFPIVIRKEKKTELVNYLEQNGIETRDMCPLINQPYYRTGMSIREEDFPVAKWINESGFYIASHQGLTEVEKRHIVDVFDGFYSKRAIRKDRAALVVMSKGDGRAARSVFESLPVSMFDELFLVEASDDKEVSDFYSKRGFKIICESLGKGALLKKAVSAASSDKIVVMGLDGADDPRDINDLLIRLRQDNDLVIASRFMPGGGRESGRILSYRSVGNRFFSFILSIIFSRNISDCNNLFRAFTKSGFQNLGLREDGESIMFEMTVKCLGSKLKFAECPTLERHTDVARKRRNRLISALSFGLILLRHLFSSRSCATHRHSRHEGESKPRVSS